MIFLSRQKGTQGVSVCESESKIPITVYCERKWKCQWISNVCMEERGQLERLTVPQWNSEKPVSVQLV